MSIGKVRRLTSLPEPSIKILNEGDNGKNITKPAVDVAKDLQKLMLR